MPLLHNNGIRRVGVHSRSPLDANMSQPARLWWPVSAASSLVGSSLASPSLPSIPVQLTRCPFFITVKVRAPLSILCLIGDDGLISISEVAARIATIYCAQILDTGFSGLIAAGVFAGMDGLRGVAGWQWLFIVEGIATAAVAILGFWLLPNAPLTTRWLDKRERQLAQVRIDRDKLADSEGEASAWEGLRQACRDKRTWLFTLMKNST